MTRQAEKRPVIALGRRFSKCAMVHSLGVRPNFDDYDEQERSLILNAPKIYDPSSFYAELFDTLGIPTFPNYQTYKFAQDKIKQTALFQMAGIRHPRTHVFYGSRQKSTAADLFPLPLIAKQARGSALGRGVYLIRTQSELMRYLKKPGPAYIQEYLPIDRDIRVVVIGGRIVHAYWRVSQGKDFRTNLGAGAAVELAKVPQAALDLALQAATLCRWDDVGIDICEYGGRYYILEGNMKYGLEGFKAAGMDYHAMLSEMIENGEI